jgi:CDGSH-type Zn-finger protein
LVKRANEAREMQPEIHITKNGPYLVMWPLSLTQVMIGTNDSGESVRWESGRRFPPRPPMSLCRCGGSASKPYCDGTHARIGFDGTETASRKPYRELAKTIPGPTASLMDAESLCAFARFCDPNGQVWTLVGETNDEAAKRDFVRQTCDCPSGRLVAVDNATGKPIEPHYEPSLALIEDPAEGCSGPLWVRGGVRLVGSDGFQYEPRNRVTLCRCGASKNKPFCDGSHAAIKFRDGIAPEPNFSP